MLMYEIFLETENGKLWLGHGSKPAGQELWQDDINDVAYRFRSKLPRACNVRIKKSDNGLCVNEMIFRATA